MSDYDDAAVGQYRLHASIETAHKVFIVGVEDHEGCGTIEVSVHTTLAGATVALREMVESEYEGYKDFQGIDVHDMDADEITETIEDLFGKTAKVEQHEVLA